MAKRKVLLIGWDAADWKVINPLMEQGFMPHLESMVNNGVMGNLETLDPPLSPMLWTSIATGKRPYKHGIIGFGEVADDGKSIGPVTLRNRKTKAVWNILNEHGYKTHVIGWWPSHPAEEVNGIYISNFYQKAARPINEPWKFYEHTVHPNQMAELFADMRIHPQEITENHISNFVHNPRKVDQKKDNGLEVLTKIIAENATIHAAATYILENEAWDFMAVYYDGIDHFNHAFMKYHPPMQPHVNPEQYEHYKDAVAGGYRFHDMMLGRLIALAGSDATIMLVSDHGFHPDHLRRRKVTFELAGPSQEHSQYGIICATGDGIKKDEIVFGASLLDVTPTILSLYNLPSAIDMDGKVLNTIYEDNNFEAKKIKTFDDAGGYSGISATANSAIDSQILQQMIDLGYIEKQGADMDKNVKRMQEDNDYFLARSYMGGQKYFEAAKILLPLFQSRKSNPRVFGSLITCYCKLAQYDDALALIDEVKSAWKQKYDEHVKEATEKNTQPDVFRYPADILFHEAFLYYSKLDNFKAIELFNEVLPQLNNKSIVNLYLGNVYFNTGNIEKAKHHFESELDINYDCAEAHYGLGLCEFKNKNYEHALSHFLDCVSLKFDFALAHYHLGEVFYKMKQYNDAVGAYEVCLQQNAGINKARARLIKLYTNHVSNQNRLAYHNTYKVDDTLPLIYVVSGLPRSGTSLMMKMLEAAGLNIFSDNERMSDDNNPTGYYEHKAVMQLARNHEFLNGAENKVVKIVAPLLQYLPMNFRYKIIFMTRHLDEVLLSQATMLVRTGKKQQVDLNLNLANSYSNLLNEVKQWQLKFNKNIEMIEIDFAQLHNNADEGIAKISSFLETDNLLVTKMKAQINADLYRSKVSGK